MKIGILTQPLLNNYGGLLQAYALQKILKNMGHEVWTIDSQFKKEHIFSFFIIIVKRIILKIIFKRKDISHIIPVRPNNIELNHIRQNTNRFIKQNINTTIKTTLTDLKSIIKQYSFHALIVGSDQVWRPIYSPNLNAYFLESIKTEKNIKRISYAASFGTDNWDFSRLQTKKYKDLIKLFDLVTVREDSAVKLCSEKFNVDAIKVLDPTLLLKKNDYLSLIRDYEDRQFSNFILVYILDESKCFNDSVKMIASELKIEVKIIKPEKVLEKNFRENINEYVLPPVEQWINDFYNAKYIITDSYHGSVFSIIFNKPFLALGNLKRGLSRFESLFDLLDLKERLVFKAKEITSPKLLLPIDFSSVNQIIENERIKALKLLDCTLNN